MKPEQCVASFRNPFLPLSDAFAFHLGRFPRQMIRQVLPLVDYPKSFNILKGLDLRCPQV